MEYYITLIIIYFILGLVELNGKHEIRRSDSYLFFMLLPLFILTAFRSQQIGNDTLNYVESYEFIQQATSLSKAMLYSRMESGYVMINYWAGQIGMDFFQFQIVTSAFMYAGFYYFIRRYSPNYAFSCLLLITMGFMAGSMCLVRMYIAISFILFSIPFLLKRKWIKYLLFVVLATCFHKSAAFCGLMLPLCMIPYSKKLTILMLVGANVILYLGITFFQWMTESIGFYEGYVESDYFNDFNKLAIMMQLLINVAIYMYIYTIGYYKTYQYINPSPEVNKYGSEISINYYNRMAMLVILCLSIIGLSNTIMSRISDYFNVCLIIMLPISLLYVKRQKRLFAYLVIALSYTAFFMAIRILRPDWNHITPYEWGF